MGAAERRGQDQISPGLVHGEGLKGCCTWQKNKAVSGREEMTSLLTAIFLSRHRQGGGGERDGDRKKAADVPLVFVQGLTEGEQDFVRDNRTQLGSGKAKHAWDAIVEDWKIFRSIPIVLQLLVLVVLLLVVIFAPFVGNVILMAIQSPDQHAAIRMMVSLGALAVLSVAILMVLLLM